MQSSVQDNHYSHGLSISAGTHKGSAQEWYQQQPGMDTRYWRGAGAPLLTAELFAIDRCRGKSSQLSAQVPMDSSHTKWVTLNGSQNKTKSYEFRERGK